MKIASFPLGEVLSAVITITLGAVAGGGKGVSAAASVVFLPVPMPSAAALRMAAVALQRSHSALGAAFRRISRRKGFRVVVFATVRKLAQLVYRMLRW